MTRWVAFVRRHAVTVNTALLVATVGLGAYAALNLGVNSDTVQLLDDDLPSQRALREFAELFPILNNALLVVVDAETPELARAATDGVAAALRSQPEWFRDVHIPGGGEFFERNGLLYRDVEDLEDFADHLARVQPILAELERDASIGQLAVLVQQALEHRSAEDDAPEYWSRILDRVSHATVSVYEEVPLAVSWEELLLAGTALDPTTRHVILVDPVLDYTSLLAAGRSIQRIRDAAAQAGFGPEQGVRVRVTGNPALNYDEMWGIAWDVGVAGVFCFLLVATVLYRALRSVALVVASLATLLAGLVWTAAVAAAGVGHLNLVSIAFAVLFIGLGVDFTIHLGMSYAARRRDGTDHATALGDAARQVGSSLVLCAFTTAMGFYSFVPTDYKGVAELGLIAGTGMVVILFQTLTFFPALVSSWLRFDPHPEDQVRLRFEPRTFGWIDRRGAAVRFASAALALVSLVLVTRTEFDPDVVKLRDPESESVQAFEDLLARNDHTSPWFANVLVSDLKAAESIEERYRQLPAVGRVVSLLDYVPEDQEEKREILGDLLFMLDTGAGARAEAPPPVEEQIAALRQLRDFLGRPGIGEENSALGQSAARLRAELQHFLNRAEFSGQSEAALAQLEELLLGQLPDHIARLRRALDPQEVTLANLPAELRTRMLTPDGRARVQIFPRENLTGELALKRFVDAVYAHSPEATGLAVNLVEFGHATERSLQQALVTATLLITVLLVLLWRRVWETLLVLLPLSLGALLTVGTMVLLGIEWNFANVIVVPLLLGIGVDSGIHLVHRAVEGARRPTELLGTTTARAVAYSAFTTIASFGSLAFSSHRGMASLGILLVIGMLAMLFSNLITLPALLAWRPPGTGAKTSE
ncbi:MAG: MMPL family transporter [Proteobacteria bacterium]|nr:MMPL family transporter [Pseudomonadota bacterium]